MRLCPPSCPGPASRCLEWGLPCPASLTCGVPGRPCRWAGVPGAAREDSGSQPPGRCLPRGRRPTSRGPGRQALALHPWPDLAAPRARGQGDGRLALSERPVLALGTRCRVASASWEKPVASSPGRSSRLEVASAKPPWPSSQQLSNAWDGSEPGQRSAGPSRGPCRVVGSGLGSGLGTETSVLPGAR